MGKHSVEEVLVESQYKQYDMVVGGPTSIPINQASILSNQQNNLTFFFPTNNKKKLYCKGH